MGVASLVKCSLGMQEALILIPSAISNPSTPLELELEKQELKVIFMDVANSRPDWTLGGPVSD